MVRIRCKHRFTVSACVSMAEHSDTGAYLNCACFRRLLTLMLTPSSCSIGLKYASILLIICMGGSKGKAGIQLDVS